MNKKEIRVILSAYTGILISKDFSEVHEYIETIMNRPVMTHEWGDLRITDEIRERCRSDFLRVVDYLSDIEKETYAVH